MAPIVSSDTSKQVYAERTAQYRTLVLEYEGRSRLLSNFRGLLFGLSVITLGFALFRPEEPFLFGVFAVLGIGFLVLVVLHARVIGREEDARRLLWVNEAAEKRATDAFRSLPDDGASYAVENHAYADDIDILGPSSLFQKLCVAHTRFGQMALAQWLLAPAAHDVIVERQMVVKALAPKLELRQQLEAESLLVSGVRSGKSAYKPPVDPEPLLVWAEGSPELLNKPGLSWVPVLLPLVTLTLLVLARTLGWAPFVWLVPAALQVGLAFALGPAANRVFGSVSSTEGAFVRYGGMLALLDGVALQGKLAEKWQSQTRPLGKSASSAMKEFRNRLGWFDLKHNGLIYPFVNLLFLWDINCTLALERWQRRFGKHVRGWFEAIGEFEALSSLAGLLYDEPGFVFPEVEPGFFGFEAEGLGHPLISRDKRVVNDVALPQAGTALLVTGSNMSGKSTLLRSMGLSTVLALAGGPVCAQRLRMGAFSLHTSMRVRDSLQSGVSHFYAELRKLKAVVDRAQAKGSNVFFLLDEILHGTNSKERQLGARWVMSELLRLGATGAVSTHDLELCQLPPDQMGRVELVHLRENVENGQMVFDFKVRKGPVTEGNALRLMRILGLAVPLVDEAS